MQNVSLVICEKDNGKPYIGDFLDILDEEIYEKVTTKLKYFEMYPSRLELMKSKNVSPLDKETGLYEIGFSMQGHWYRFLGEWVGESFHVVHAFRKKSNKTPKRHIETANNRLNWHCK